MMKKTSFISAYSSLQQCCVCPPQTSCISTTSLQNFPAQPARPQSQTANKRRKVTEPSTWIPRRTYATVRQSNGPDFRDNMNWPCRKSESSNPFVPSPYEIFEMHTSASYGRATKLKYFELVKIYHPDRSSVHVGCEGLSHPERLERYRLIVLAHEILSDPAKRRAYDAYGAGWGAKQHSATRHSRGYSSTATGQQYGQGAGYDNSPFGNATWEDWERWYRRASPDNQKQAYAGTYINPNAFAVFVITIAILSGVLQATRASTLAGNMAEKQLAFTEETSRFMSARATQFDDNKLTSDGRVKHFLEKRDPTRYGLKEEEQVQYRKHFGDGSDVPPLGRTREKNAADPADDEEG